MWRHKTQKCLGTGVAVLRFVGVKLQTDLSRHELNHSLAVVISLPDLSRMERRFRRFRTRVCVAALLLFLGLYSANSLQLNDDVLGLIVFKADLQDPTGALKSWNEDDNSPCNWTGIKCDPLNARVIAVQLDGLSLSGRLGIGLAKLVYLRNLSLANNNISGTIDAELALLRGLITVNLSRNVLLGPISPAFGNLTSLRVLDFSSNALSGVIPSELFSNCRSLRYISLSTNFLEGAIPESISSCPDLRTLNLSDNYLSGVMPATMQALQWLSVLDVSYNLISGEVPAFLPSLSNLVYLSLRSNRFLSAIPEQIGNCISLQYVDLSSNFLSDGLPETMQRLKLLHTVILGYGFLTGIIPSWIGNLTSLKILNLTHNFLHGEIPSTIGWLQALQTLDLSNNRLSGPIPRSISGCARLISLDLSSNNFSDAIPGEILLPTLFSLRMSFNSLTGLLPGAFYSQCGSLQILDLSKNQLYGDVPMIGTCIEMESLNVSSNFLSGNIPIFPQATAVQVIDLSHNQLVGSIPTSIGDATELSVLYLNANNLTGSIPPDIDKCPQLTNINLARNNLNGSIPPELGNLTGLQSLDISYNKISGVIPAELGQLHRLEAFNVSYNQLEGPIPADGIFNKINESAFVGNSNLCGADVNVTCPSVMPKPIVLNPNSSDLNSTNQNPLIMSQHKRIVLSASAILAISAAAAISVGVVIVLVLNVYAQSLPRSTSHILDSLSPSLSSDSPIGKLVMFTKNSDPRSEEWVTSAHALLNKDSELGRGGFGTVYKAVLADGRTVAIKKLMVSSLVKSQEDFEKEIQLLGKIKHQNLLGLQGYYWTPQLQLLIYDFISKGNLYSRLHEKSNSDGPLSWSSRFRIALGTARGLAHLHHGCHPQVIHYNMKSSNVLLDENCNPKIADYGLAKLLPMLDRYLMSSKFQSALGYMAPEFACQSLKINEKCDVYGFGVMLLELVTGRRPVEYMEDDMVILCDYVRSLLDEGKAMTCVDSNMQDYADDEVLPMIKLGLICTSQVPSNRPSMAEVVQILELVKTPGSSGDLL